MMSDEFKLAFYDFYKREADIGELIRDGDLLEDLLLPIPDSSTWVTLDGLMKRPCKDTKLTTT